MAALAIAAAPLAVAPSAQAGEIESRHHGGEVTIAARYPTALQGIDPLVFEVTRSEATGDDLDVGVTVSSGIVSARKLSHTVTIPAGETEAVLSVPTGDPAPGAVTGDVTATIDDKSGYDVGDPSSASVRLHVGDPMVTVRFDQESYTVAEDAGLYTGIKLIARTVANVPAPNSPIPAAVFFESGTATTPEDYGAGLLLLSFGASGWAADGDTYVSSPPVPLTPVDDSESEDDETLRVVLGAPPDLPGTVDFVAADGTACTDSCTAEVIILDDDDDHSGLQELDPLEVTIEAVHPTAVGGVDDLVFELIRSSTSEGDLEVPVTLSSGILASSELSHTVTIPAQATTAELSVSTENVVDGASTGDVIATVGDGDMHDVGHPSTAAVRLYLGGGIVKVGLDAGAYRLDESVGTTTNEIRLKATTIPGVPAPRDLAVPIWTRGDTATSSDDYAELSETVTFPGPWTAENGGDGNSYMSEVLVPLSIIDDDEAEGDETFTLMVGFPPGSSGTVSLLTLDSAPPCDSEGCGSDITITDNDNTTIIDSNHSGDVTIAAAHPTALQGIDDLVFTVTRSSASEEDLEVPVTLSPGIIAADRLSHTVTIPANETSAELTVRTETLDPAATTGDVTATVGDGESHDVGDPSSVTVRVYVGTKLVTVRFNAVSYMLAEDGGGSSGRLVLLARTEPGVPAPTGTFQIAVTTQPGTASSPDDYGALSSMFSFPGSPPAGWYADGDAFWAEVLVPLTIVDDTEAEGDETLLLLQERTPGLPSTVELAPAEPEAQTCSSTHRCEATVTIVDDDNRGVTLNHAKLAVDEGNTAVYTVVLTRQPTDDVTVTPEVQGAKDADITVSGPVTFTPQDWSSPQTVTVTAAADDNRLHGSATVVHTVTGADYEENGVTAPSVPVTEWDAEGRTVVTLVHVPDGTVIPDNSSLTVGETVQDGTTFTEGERVLFRLQFAAADGGPPVGGADVELTAWWSRESPLVPTSGHISRVEFSLPRVTQWDTAIQILDNDVGNPAGTATIRITGCKRNGCEIGEPSEITVTIADDDGGPETAPPGKPYAPRLVCASSGDGYDSTGIAVSWQAPDFVGGAPIDHYELRYRPQTVTDGEWQIGGEWQAWPHHSATTSTVISGLESDVLYGVQVRAVNANGPGQWSPARFHRTGQLDEICEILDRLTP